MSGVTYAWVRVGDGEPEPAAIIGKAGNRKATTFGCPDTFDVDRKDSGCSIVLVVSGNYADNKPGGTDRHANLYGRAREALIPSHLSFPGPEDFVEIDKSSAAQREADYQREIKYQPHSYAGFGRRGQS